MTPTAPIRSHVDDTIASLTGAVYEQAPETEKVRFVELLLRPLGVMAAAVVANGVFGRLVVGRPAGVQGLSPDDIKGIQAQDIAQLAARAQDISWSVLEHMARLIASSPQMATTATAAALLALLAHQRPRYHRSMLDEA